MTSPHFKWIPVQRNTVSACYGFSGAFLQTLTGSQLLTKYRTFSWCPGFISLNSEYYSNRLLDSLTTCGQKSYGTDLHMRCVTSRKTRGAITASIVFATAHHLSLFWPGWIPHISRRRRSFNILNLSATDFFFQILAHSVFKMWVIQKPNKVALWNKRHFEGEKWRLYSMFKIFSTDICWINIKWGT